MKRSLIIGTVLIALASAYFGFRQLPNADVLLRILASVTTFIGMSIVVGLVMLAGLVLSVRNRGRLFFLTSFFLTAGLILAGTFCQPDRHHYNFDPDVTKFPPFSQ